MRKPTHEELTRLIESIEARKVKVNKYEVPHYYGEQTYVTFDAFNFGINHAIEIVTDFVAQLEAQDEPDSAGRGNLDDPLRSSVQH